MQLRKEIPAHQLSYLVMILPIILTINHLRRLLTLISVNIQIFLSMFLKKRWILSN